MKKVLTIAGSDSSGGAGIQADIKTMCAHGVYAMSAISALTAQNTLGVSGIFEVSPEFLKAQIDAVFEDIVPDAVKIGMVSSGSLTEVIAERLEFYRAKNIVLDPVMVATSGSELMKSSTISVLTEKLFPRASLITPNISEAQVLCNMKILNKTDMERAGKTLFNQYGCSVLVKGGHLTDSADDLLIVNGEIKWLCGERVDNPNNHGTGCTLSSAIASNLAKGLSIEEAVIKAKEYITGALHAQLNLGHGSGPLNHMFTIKKLLGF